MKKLILAIGLLCSMLLVGCSEKKDVANSDLAEGTARDSEIPTSEEKEYIIDPSFANIKKVGDVYMMIDQTYELYVDSELFEHIPRGVHIILANPTNKTQSTQFLKDVVHTYNSSNETSHMVMDHGIFDDKFPTTLDPGAIMSTYYVYYWPSFDSVHDNGKLTYNANGKNISFNIPEIRDSKLYTDVRTTIYKFISENTSKKITFVEPNSNNKKVDCSQFLAKAKECLFNSESGEIEGFVLQDGTQYIYPRENSVGRITTVTTEQDVLYFYFDENGLIRVETADGHEVKITPEMLIIFAMLEEMAKFMSEQSYPEEVEQEKFTESSTKKRLNTAEANKVIIDLIRPTSQAIETAINTGQIKGSTQQNTTTYHLDNNIMKVVKDFGDYTMSATYKDGKLLFLMRVDKSTDELLRYYFYEDQMIRVLYSTGDTEHYEDTTDQQYYLETEKELLVEYSLDE